MSEQSEEYKLRKLYGDIIQGISLFKYKKQKVFIRHFSPVEQGALDGEYLSLYDKAISRGLSTEKERLLVLIQNGLWKESEEKDLEDWNKELKGKIDTKNTLYYDSQIQQVNKEIEVLSKKISVKQIARYHAMGLTAEQFARRKMNELYILSSLFKTKDFSCPLYDDEEFEELDEYELDEVVQLYNKEITDFQGSAIGKIALSSFFQKYFLLCEDNISHFYGKPIVQLTYYQAQLAEYGKYFKHVLSQEQKPPNHILNDPDKVIEWFNTGNNGKRQLSAHDSSKVMSLVGSAEDIRKVAEAQGEEVVSFAQIAAKEGKTRLNKKDLMRILG